jgi:2-keto-4-pentenoate hydratase/2-oxohepta-3-ene-1,7-dioic acid hydratase in catechol pathway
MRMARVETVDGLRPYRIAGTVALPLEFEDASVPADVVDGFRRFGSLSNWRLRAEDSSRAISVDSCSFGRPIASPGQVIGVGLNYVLHAADLAARIPERPVIFFKGRHTIIGHGERLFLPSASQRVTAEAELGLIIGTPAFEVSVSDALDYVGGVCCVLDMTAEDILQEDPRMLTLSKNYTGFFAYGPEVASLGHLIGAAGSLESVEVATYLNGQCVRRATVGQMRFSPAELLSFISHVLPLMPGDIISTGTPGAVVLASGDLAECRITGLGHLTTPVAAAGS